MTDQKPGEAQQRAVAAAEELSLAGDPVTNRAVRERAGVSMTVASKVAQEWNARMAAQAATPEMPEVVHARFEALWREIYAAAREQFAAERRAHEEKLRAVEEERDTLAEDLAQAEARAEQAEQAQAETVDAVDRAARGHTEQVSLQRSRADRAEGALEAITAERDRLLEQIRELSDTNTKPKKA